MKSWSCLPGHRSIALYRIQNKNVDSCPKKEAVLCIDIGINIFMSNLARMFKTANSGYNSLQLPIRFRSAFKIW